MSVKIMGYLTYRKVVGEQYFPLNDGDETTLNHLLDWLSIQLGSEFTDLAFDPQTKALSRQVAVLINGRHHAHLPDGLGTILHDGDEVSIFPPVAGGQL
jgi:molybdopterin synthase sulfur carrier subunit